MELFKTIKVAFLRDSVCNTCCATHVTDLGGSIAVKNFACACRLVSERSRYNCGLAVDLNVDDLHTVCREGAVQFVSGYTTAMH